MVHNNKYHLQSKKVYHNKFNNKISMVHITEGYCGNPYDLHVI